LEIKYEEGRMAKFTKKITIKAPPKKVFDFVIDPDNWTKYVTSLVNVRDLKSKEAKKGMTFKWTYRMLGLNMHGKGEITEFVRNKRFGLKMEGAHPIAENYSFLDKNGSTELTFEIEYEIPGKIMGVIEKTGLVEKLNKKESENVLSKIKMFCEE
jgi:coenzyme Q-binding protein COQ10